MKGEDDVHRARGIGDRLMQHPYTAYQDTVLWRAIAGVLVDLKASGEVRVETAPEYVIGYLCRELEAKGVVTEASLTRR